MPRAVDCCMRRVRDEMLSAFAARRRDKERGARKLEFGAAGSADAGDTQAVTDVHAVNQPGPREMVPLEGGSGVSDGPVRAEPPRSACVAHRGRRAAEGDACFACRVALLMDAGVISLP